MTSCVILDLSCVTIIRVNESFHGKLHGPCREFSVAISAAEGSQVSRYGLLLDPTQLPLSPSVQPYFLLNTASILICISCARLLLRRLFLVVRIAPLLNDISLFTHFSTNSSPVFPKRLLTLSLAPLIFFSFSFQKRYIAPIAPSDETNKQSTDRSLASISECHSIPMDAYNDFVSACIIEGPLNA